MGFVAPFNNQVYVAGAEQNFHVHAPVKGSIKYNPAINNNSLEALLEPLNQGNEKQQLFQLSNKLYTASQKIGDVKPDQQGQDVLPVYSKPIKQFYQKTLGQEMSGYGFDITIRGEENRFNMANAYKFLNQHDPISALLYGTKQRQIQNDYVSVKYNPQNSSPQQVNLTLSIISNEHSPASPSRLTKKHPKFVSQRMSSANTAQPESNQGRRQELLEKVQSGIQDAKAHVFDASISFGGRQENAGYSFTLAHANSPVSQLSRVLFYYNGRPIKESENTKQYQASGQVEIRDPELSPYNHREALNQESTTTIEGQFQESKSGAKISLQGKLERSNERKEHVRQMPNAKICEEQMQRGDYFQPACRNISLDANYLDKYNFVINYQNVPDTAQWALYKAYGVVRNILFPYNSEEIQSQGNSDNQITVNMQFAKDLRAANVSIDSPRWSSKFENITMPQMAIPAFVYHPRYNTIQLYTRKLFNTGIAVLDGKSATTFNNKSYPIDLGNCYHVFAVYAPHEELSSQQEYRNRDAERKFAILVKESDSQSREVQITFGNDQVHLRPGVSVEANGQKIDFSEQKTSWWSNGQNAIEGYVQAGGVHVLRFPRQGMEVSYDGSRLQLALPSLYRSRVRGLAGTYNGEDSTDFSAPDNQVVRDPLLFAASYALTQDQACRGPAKDRQQEAQKAPRYEKTSLPGNVVSDLEAGREQQQKQKQKISRTKNQMARQMNEKTPLTELRTRYIEDGDRTCFSTRPQIACTSHAKPSQMIQKTVDFHCIQTSSASRHWVQMIKNGANPDFSQKGANRQISRSLPLTCEPKA